MTGSDADWTLDPRLARDTVAVGDLALSRLLVMDDARFPWAILVPRRQGAVEPIDLAEHDQQRLTREIATIGAALRAVTVCHKLNIAALGNLVPQLHVHVVARFRHDAAWPRPVWGSGPAQRYDPAARERLVAARAAAIG